MQIVAYSENGLHHDVVVPSFLHSFQKVQPTMFGMAAHNDER